MIINWVDYTGALDISFKYEFCKKNNTISLVIDQRNNFTEYLARRKFLNSKKKEKVLSAYNLYSKDYLQYFDEDQTREDYTFERNRDCIRWFHDQ